MGADPVRGGAEQGARAFRWGFGSAVPVVLALVVAGHVALTTAERVVQGESGPLQATAFGGFVLASLVFLFLQRAAVLRFFRSMHVGVTLVTLSLLAVAAGVLVPQITNFEDPSERVPAIDDVPAEVQAEYLPAAKLKTDEEYRRMPGDHPALAGLSADQVARIKRYKNEYAAFRWAEGYFVYHLLHLYGIGMPEADLPAGIGAKLDVFQDRYGIEERQNREKQMVAAFRGQSTAREIGALIRAHEPAFRRAFALCTALELNRAYKSHWFATLLGLLFVGVLLNTFRVPMARWFTLEKGGFVLVHFGVMTLLAGGLWSKVKTDRGILNLTLGDQPKDVYHGYFDPGKPRRMPFALALDRFARRDWKTLQIGFFDEDLSSSPPAYTLWPGRSFDLDFVTEGVRKRPRIRIEVREVHERALVGAPRWWEADRRDDPSGMGPLAILSAIDRTRFAAQNAPAEAHEERVFLTPDPRFARFVDPHWRFRLAVHYGDDVEAARELATPHEDDAVGLLAMRVAAAGDVEPLVEPVRVGQTVDGPGGYRLRVVAASGDLRFDQRTKSEILDPRPLAEQFPANPGIVVEISPPDGGPVERRVVSESFDAESHQLQKEYAYPDLTLALEWERWTSPGPQRYVLAWGPSLAPVLVDAQGTRTPVAPNDALPLPGDTQVIARELMHNVRFEKRIEFDPEADFISGPEYDEHFYAHDPTGVVLAVTTDPGTASERTETVRMASTSASRANVWSSADRRFWLRYYENTEAFPFEWRSVLSVYEKDAGGRWRSVDVGPEREREIRVNDYLVHRGYRFFQTNADARFPDYSGIGVVYDPGIPVVMYGMWLTILGAGVAFLARPITRSRAQRAHARPGAAARAASARPEERAPVAAGEQA